MEFSGNWDEQLPLVEFTYNNSYHRTIGIAPFEALYGRKCQTPLCWANPEDQEILGPELITETTKTIKLIQERLKATNSRTKAVVDKK